MTDDKLGALQTEYERYVVGPIIFALVTKTLQGLLSKRDPAIYAPYSASSDRAADAVQDFVIDVLIAEGQLNYIFTVAMSYDDVNRLLRFQARRYLARARVRTVIDNLIARALTFLRSATGVASSTVGGREIFTSVDAGREDFSPPRNGLNRAVALASCIPKTLGDGDQRASAVYSAERLAAVVRTLLANYSGPVGVAELDDFFSKLLTAWKPSFLGLVEGADPADHSLLPEEEILATNLAERLASEMTGEERLIYSYKHANLPDRELAKQLNLSRQSLSPRKRRLFERLAQILGDLEESVQSAVLERLATLLTDGPIRR